MKQIQKLLVAGFMAICLIAVWHFNNTERKTMNSNKIFHATDHEVTFQNIKDDITLSGTLSIPNTQHKPAVVILISGMGPNDRDNTVMGRKLFLPVSDYFTQHGIAVLRYDKRGIGKSSGVFNMTLTSVDFANDVKAAVQFLRSRSDIDNKKIGLVGTSEGGLIAFMVASELSDVAFVVSMAGAASNDVNSHFEMQLKADGATEQFLESERSVRKELFNIINTQSPAEAQKKLTVLLKNHVDSMTNEQKAEAKNLPFAITSDNYLQMIDMFNSAWYRYYLKTDSINFMSKVTVPVLAINGELDFCIAAKTALPKIEQGLKMANNQDFTIITIPNQNHWFQECKTGAMHEMSTIQEIMNESTLKLVADWIRRTTESLTK